MTIATADRARDESRRAERRAAYLAFLAEASALIGTARNLHVADTLGRTPRDPAKDAERFHRVVNDGLRDMVESGRITPTEVQALAESDKFREAMRVQMAMEVADKLRPIVVPDAVAARDHLDRLTRVTADASLLAPKDVRAALAAFIREAEVVLRFFMAGQIDSASAAVGDLARAHAAVTEAMSGDLVAL